MSVCQIFSATVINRNGIIKIIRKQFSFILDFEYVFLNKREKLLKRIYLFHNRLYPNKGQF